MEQDKTTYIYASLFLAGFVVACLMLLFFMHGFRCYVPEGLEP